MENRVENGDYVVAIDLGTNTVVTVVGTKDEDGRIRIVDREVSPVQGMGMVRGEIKNIELVSQSIKATVAAIEQRQQIRITEAYAGVSGQHIRCVKHPYHVFSRGGEIRQEDVQHLHDSMRNVPAPEGEKILQIIPQSYVVDDEEETSSPVGTFGTKLASTFNILLGDSTAISRVEMALKRGGIAPLGLFLNAVASAEAVLSEDEKQEGVAVIDIGGGTTDVTVYEKNIIRHVGIVPMGGNVVNKDIRSYGILEKHVESLKTRYGGAMREKAQPDKFITTPGLSAKAPKEISCQNLAAIIEARMQDIIDFAVEEIKKSGYQNKLSAGVVLTGGGAQLRDLDALFKSYTGMDVRVAGPEAGVAGGRELLLTRRRVPTCRRPSEFWLRLSPKTVRRVRPARKLLRPVPFPVLTMRPSPRPASAGRRSTICIGTTRERPATDSPLPASPSRRSSSRRRPRSRKEAGDPDFSPRSRRK